MLLRDFPPTRVMFTNASATLGRKTARLPSFKSERSRAKRKRVVRTLDSADLDRPISDQADDGAGISKAMVEFIRGNLLEADVDALVNTVNTKGVMGKGVALQFRRAFPANYKAYRGMRRRRRETRPHVRLRDRPIGKPARDHQFSNQGPLALELAACRRRGWSA
jgi:hypothetical protein